jgi:nucleoside-diphosphate-sugar epimerase
MVGRQLVLALGEQAYNVISFSIENGDITRDPLPMDGIDHVFHLAAKVFVPESWSAPLPFYNVNVLGTVNVLEHCRSRKVPVTLVSSYVYGTPQRLPVSEDHPAQAFNPYCHTKLMAEDVCLFYQRVYGVPVTIVRPFNLYGPGQDSRFLIPMLVRQAVDPSRKAFRVQDPDPKRDHLHVQDLASLLIRTIDGPRSIYNAGTGKSASIADIVAILNRLTGSTRTIIAEGQPRANEVMDVYADITRARTELGWQPQVTLDEGLRRLLADASSV